MEKKKKPLAVDVQVGARIRLRRTMLGMSQTKLAEGLHVSFQQVQKYENTNRVGASRMQAIATILKVPASHFFEDQPYQESGPEDPLASLFSTAEGLTLARDFVRIESSVVRARLVQLAKALANYEVSESEE